MGDADAAASLYFPEGGDPNEQCLGYAAPRFCALADNNSLIHGHEYHSVAEYIQHFLGLIPGALFGLLMPDWAEPIASPISRKRKKTCCLDHFSRSFCMLFVRFAYTPQEYFSRSDG